MTERNERTYRWQEFFADVFTSRKELESLHVVYEEQWRKEVVEGLESKLIAKVLVEDMTNRRITKSQIISFDLPANSWQLFKQEHESSWWLGWLVRRWPIRFQSLHREVTCFHSLNPMLLFPEQTQVPRNFGRAVRYVKIAKEEFRVYDQAADYRQIR